MPDEVDRPRGPLDDDTRSGSPPRDPEVDPILGLTQAERRNDADPRVCPACGGYGGRIHTRREVNGVHRRRQCKSCRRRWTTIEVDLDRVQEFLYLERMFAQAWLAVRAKSQSLLRTPEGSFIQAYVPFGMRREIEVSDPVEDESDESDDDE